jgi:DNA-binding GntR family transcriptional regulator
MSEIISEELTGWIMDGTLNAGQRIREDEIAEAFGVSRIPVREALHVLNNKGLVEIEPYVGTTVSQLTEKDIEEIYYLRSILEPIACERAADFVTDEDIQALDEIQVVLEDLCAQENDHLAHAKKVYQFNREFHMGIYSLSQMDNLMKIIDNLWDRIAFLRVRAAFSEGYPAQMEKEHRSYLKLLHERDGKKLAFQMQTNLRQHLDQIKATGNAVSKPESA